MKTKPLTSRRLFFWKAGAALSAPLAAAAAHGSPGFLDERGSLEARLAWLEDMNAIRELHERFVRYVNAGAYEKAAALFDDPEAAPLDTAIRRISLDGQAELDVIERSPDGKTATGRLHCTVHSETPIEPQCTLVEMARQQGGGVVKRTERVVLESAYLKRRGAWKIQRLAYRPV